MRELDLYDGVGRPAEEPSADAGHSTPGAVPPQSAAPQASRPYPEWVDALWRTFPAAVRERYRPLSVLGEGGMGIVLEVHDLRMDRVVAIKGVRDPARLDSAARQRFAREARLHARLAHPNILPIFDAWTDGGGNPWCSMLRVGALAGQEGAPTLAGRLHALAGLRSVETRPLSELLETFRQVCRAVAHAHAQGILHRDLKPENILLGASGEALVADWGLAIEAGSEFAEVAGSPPYAAPEQMGAFGRPCSDERSDVFGLGAILHEMITGSRFTVATSKPIGEFPMPRRVPPELANIVRRAIAYDPGDRFPSVQRLLKATDAYLEGGLVEGMSYSATERAVKWIQARPGVSAAIVTALVFSSMLALSYWRQQQALAEDAARLKAQYEVAQQNLAYSHAGWAAVEDARGHPDEAQASAAQAFKTALEAPKGWTLPDGPVYPIFARHSKPSALLWACKLGDNIQGLRFTPDGKRLDAVCNSEWRKFELPDTRVTTAHSLGDARVWNMVLDSQGRRLAISDGKSKIRLLEFGKSEPLRYFETGQSAAKASFSPDGKTLASGGSAGVCVWDVESGRLKATLTGHKVDVWVLAYSPRGDVLVSADRSSTLRLWDGRDLHLIREIRVPNDCTLAVTFAPDGRTIAVAGSDGTVRCYGIPDGKPGVVLAAEKAAELSIAFSPDGKLLASGGGDGVARLWELPSGRQLAQLVGHTRWIWALAFSPDGQILASGADDGGLRFWDVGVAKEPAHPPSSEDYDTKLSFSPDGSRMATLTVSGTIRIVETASCQKVFETTVGPGAQEIGFDARGRLLAVKLLGGSVRLMSFESGASDRNLDIGGTGKQAALGGQARWLAVAREDRRVRLFRLGADASPLDLECGPGPIGAMAFSPDGELFAAGGKDGRLHIFTSRDGRLLAKPASPDHDVTGLSFTGDGRTLISCDDNGKLLLWAAPRWEGKKIASHQAPVMTVAVNPRRPIFASAAGEAMHVWRIPSGERVPHIELTNPNIARLAFSDDGLLLGMAGVGDPQIWELDALENPRGRIARLAASSYFVTSPSDGRLMPKSPAEAPAPHPARARGN